MGGALLERLTACGLAPEDAARVAAAVARAEPLALGDGDAATVLGAAVAAAGDAVVLGRALPPLLRAVAAQRATLSPYARAVAAHLRGIEAWRLEADVPEATRALNHACALLEGLATPAARAYAGRVHDTFGQLLHHQGLLLDAREAFERASTLKEAGGDRAGLALTQGNLGRLCMALGDFRAAARHLTDDHAYVVGAPAPDARLEGVLLTQLGACRTELGELDEARRCLERGRACAAGDAVGVAFATVHLGRLAIRAGDLASADAHAREALRALAALAPDAAPEARGLAAQLAARVRWARDDLPGALAALEETQRWFDASTRVTPVERAELGELHASVAEAAGHRREAVALLRRALRGLDATSAEAMRRRLDDALHRLDETAWMLHASGRFVGHAQLEELLGEAGRSGFRGHEEEVTVLFSDLRGFTRIGEALSPDVLVDVINRYFGHMTRCIEHFGGRVDKFIGDAVMAVFAARPDPRTHADRAAAAALYMQADLERFNRTLPRGVGPLRAGVGLHAGRVVAGLLGSPQKRSYTVIGDVVNTASRVEGMTKLLGVPILVTQDVVRRLAEPTRWALVPLGRYRPLGRQAAVDVAHLAGVADGSPEAAAVAAHAATSQAALDVLVGRAFPEAQRRCAALEAAAAGGAGAAAYALLAAAAARFALAPPPPGWDGEIDLTEK